jgi:hypothetical protein
VTFGWNYLDGSGDEVGHSPSFADLESAEDWIGTSWRDLLDNGIEAVVLFDHERGRAVYRMGLDAQ